MLIFIKNIYTMYMVYTSRVSYNCGKLFLVSRNLLSYKAVYLLQTGEFAGILKNDMSILLSIIGKVLNNA